VPRIAALSASRIRPLVMQLGLVCAAVHAMSAEAGTPTWRVPGGDPTNAPALMQVFGCAACHTVPGVQHAVGNVGPPLTRFGDRTYIAGMLPNTPENLIRWLRAPQTIIPGNAMPDMGISDAQARDLAAYLYTLR
jgi:cytochrome c